MKRFSEMNIPSVGSEEIFDCPRISINEVVNCEVQVVDFHLKVKTKHGEGRAVVKIKQAGEELKFFTNSAYIKDVLCAVGKEGLPFLTTIKAIKLGKNTSYKFT